MLVSVMTLPNVTCALFQHSIRYWYLVPLDRPPAIAFMCSGMWWSVLLCANKLILGLPCGLVNKSGPFKSSHLSPPYHQVSVPSLTCKYSGFVIRCPLGSIPNLHLWCLHPWMSLGNNSSPPKSPHLIGEQPAGKAQCLMGTLAAHRAKMVTAA